MYETMTKEYALKKTNNWFNLINGTYVGKLYFKQQNDTLWSKTILCEA